jgi:hypothetical protein
MARVKDRQVSKYHNWVQLDYKKEEKVVKMSRERGKRIRKTTIKWLTVVIICLVHITSAVYTGLPSFWSRRWLSKHLGFLDYQARFLTIFIFVHNVLVLCADGFLSRVVGRIHMEDELKAVDRSIQQHHTVWPLVTIHTHLYNSFFAAHQDSPWLLGAFACGTQGQCCFLVS